MPEKPGPADRSASSTGRAAVLEALRSAGGPVTVPDLAERLGLHVNTVRFHLVRLVQSGFAVEERTAPAGPGRPRLGYRAAERPPAAPNDDDSPGEYRMLSQVLAGYLAASSQDPAGEARAAGRQWGRYLVDRPAPFDQPTDGDVLARVTAMLDQVGFRPETQGSGDILLHRCPFREVAERHPKVICSMHLGMLQGALDEMGAAADETSLRPFVTPNLCVARLRAPEQPDPDDDAPAGAESDQAGPNPT